MPETTHVRLSLLSSFSQLIRLLQERNEWYWNKIEMCCMLGPEKLRFHGGRIFEDEFRVCCGGYSLHVCRCIPPHDSYAMPER